MFYVPDAEDWREGCMAMLAAGFVEVQPYNPYWRRLGRRFEDPERCRVVLQNASWGSAC